MTDDEKSAMKMDEELGKKGCSTASKSTTEVKVKITKKQLEKLIGRLDVHQDALSVQQVLAQLMKLSAHYESHQRSGWRPRLQSIPEI